MAWELGRGPERACEGISVDSEGRLRERERGGGGKKGQWLVLFSTHMGCTWQRVPIKGAM